MKGSNLSNNKKEYAFCMIVAGKQHTGKTTWVEQNIVKPLYKKMPTYIYDVQGEWVNYYSEPFVDFQEFLQKVSNKKNSLIIFEEATIFFKHNSSDKVITKMLVDLYHSGNIIILNFHSLRKIPRYIIDLAQYVTLFKTDDNEELVNKKFDDEKFLDIFLEVQETENQYFNMTYKK